MIHSLVDDSLSIVRFEVGQLAHLLHIIDKGIRIELSDLKVEIEQARAKRMTTQPLEDDRTTPIWRLWRTLAGMKTTELYAA